MGQLAGLCVRAFACRCIVHEGKAGARCHEARPTGSQNEKPAYIIHNAVCSMLQADSGSSVRVLWQGAMLACSMITMPCISDPQRHARLM